MTGRTNALPKPEQPKPEQTKKVTITGNGDSSVLPDKGSTLGRVDIHTEVPIGAPQKPEQQKDVEILKNGTSTVEPDPGKVLSLIRITAKVPEPKPEQRKQLTVTRNGQQTVFPDYGSVLSAVTIDTEVPEIPQQEKSTVIYRNGDTVVYPDGGFTMKAVRIHAEVPDKSLPAETKNVSIIRNNSDTVVTPSPGYTIGQVNVRVDIPPTPGKPEIDKTFTIRENGKKVLKPDPGMLFKSVTINTEVPDQGIKLDMDVQSYTQLPAFAEEGTVGMISSLPVSSWVVAAETPEAPRRGMAWIQPGSGTTTIPAAGGHFLVAPVAAYQYDGSSWTSQVYSIYQDGQWISGRPPVVALYDNGDECTALTGGWQTYLKGQKAVDGGTMTVSIPRDQAGQGGIETAKAVDLSTYRRLAVYVSAMDVAFSNTAALSLQKLERPPQTVKLQQGWNYMDITKWEGSAVVKIQLGRGGSGGLSVSITNSGGYPGVFLE